MCRQLYGIARWRTLIALVAILAVGLLTAVADAQSARGGRGGGSGGTPRIGAGGGGRSFSAPRSSGSSRSFSAPRSSGSSRSFSAPRSSGSSRSFSAPRSSGSSRSFAAPRSSGSSRSFAAPRSSGGDRSFRGDSFSRTPDRNLSISPRSGASSVRPPAEARSSSPRIGSSLAPRRSTGDSFSAPRSRDFDAGRSFGSRSASPRQFDADRGLGRSVSPRDSRVGRGTDRSSAPRNLGIDRPDSLRRRTEAGSAGRSLDARTPGGISRSDIADRSRSTPRTSDSISRQIARPDSSSRSSAVRRAPEIAQRSTAGRTDIRRSGTDSLRRGDSPVSRSADRATADRSRSALRGSDSVARQIARPGTADRTVRRSDTAERLGRNPEIAQRSMTRTGAGRSTVDRSPISRPLDRTGRSMADRTITRTDGPGRGDATADARSIRRGTDLSRSTVGRSSRTTDIGRSSSARSLSGSNRIERTRVGREGTRLARDLQSRGVNVFRADSRSAWRHGDWGGRHWDRWSHGSWDRGHWNRGHWYGGHWDHGHWGHGHGRHYWDVDIAFVSGWHGYHGWYFNNWGWRHHHPWSFGLSFSWYSSPVYASGFSYVYPAYWYYPPVVTHYSYYYPTYYEPVVFTPIVAPVYTPVVVTPSYYYWQPAYYYYSYPVVTAAPVIETPSAWNLSLDFSADAGSSYGGSATVDEQAIPPEAPTAAAPQEDSLALGLEALRAGRTEAARVHLSRAVAGDPNSGVARMLYVAALVADGQYTNATLALRDALQIWNNVQLADFYLPSVYASQGGYTQYSRDLRAFLSDHPERLDGWLLTIWVYAFSGQEAEALALLAEAKQTWPDEPALLAIERIVQTG